MSTGEAGGGGGGYWGVHVQAYSQEFGLGVFCYINLVSRRSQVSQAPCNFSALRDSRPPPPPSRPRASVSDLLFKMVEVGLSTVVCEGFGAECILEKGVRDVIRSSRFTGHTPYLNGLFDS